MAAGAFPFEAFSASEKLKKLCILHTNDWHSRIEPFPMDGSKYQGAGGAARRATFIKQMRLAERNLLVLDDGDIFQGTPYFNYFHGELEFKIMSRMGYDCATLGNHDFDAGLDGLLKQLPNANFSFVNANYDFSNTILKDAFYPYKIFHKQGIKVGVFGLGINPDGLIPENLIGQMKYNDPIQKALDVATHLKMKEKCNLIVCLSHLGYKYDNDKVSDIVLAHNSRYIDLIVGGHTHTFLDTPDFQKNLDNQEVIINQVGWAGINVGKIDFYFSISNKKLFSNHQTVRVKK